MHLILKYQLKYLNTNLKSFQAALLKRQGYKIQTIFNEFNKIAAKSQNDTLYKHTNFYNFQFLNQQLFYEKYEIQNQNSQLSFEQIANKNNNNNQTILYKINEDMYKLRKNDTRIINLVVPYHPTMNKLKEIIRKWHESLLLKIPSLAAALPIGSIRLVQKRLPNLKIT